MTEFQHPTIATTEVHLVQEVIYQMPVTDKPETSVFEISCDANVNYSHTKQTLQTTKCVKTIKSGGPKLFRKEDPKTVTKIFNAIDEPVEQGRIPSRCKGCAFSNHHQRTEIRHRNTSGCIILGIRALEVGPDEEYC